jgi:hypothetical protein
MGREQRRIVQRKGQEITQQEQEKLGQVDKARQELSGYEKEVQQAEQQIRGKRH